MTLFAFRELKKTGSLFQQADNRKPLEPVYLAASFSVMVNSGSNPRQKALEVVLPQLSEIQRPAESGINMTAAISSELLKNAECLNRDSAKIHTESYL